MYQKVFPAGLDHLYEMLVFIKEYGLSQNMSHMILDQMTLATEEALVNIINYGYPEGKKGTIDIACENSISPPGIKITIKDQGVPFNPIENLPSTLPSRSSVLEKSDDSLGGYGIYILVELMDSVEYRRVNEENILCMIKYLVDFKNP
jgi:anti-sigma regulatory factor (Ser/Thr protein kinase)